MSKNETNDSQVLSKIARFITPFVLATAFCLVNIVVSVMDGDKSEGWSIIGFMFYLPTALVLVSFDFIFKIILKGKTLYLWIIEVILLLIGIWYFVNFIVGP